MGRKESGGDLNRRNGTSNEILGAKRACQIGARTVILYDGVNSCENSLKGSDSKRIPRPRW